MKPKFFLMLFIFLIAVMTNSVMADSSLVRTEKSNSLLLSFASISSNYNDSVRMCGLNYFRISSSEQKEKTGSLGSSPSLAEIYLKRLSEEIDGKRKVGSYLILGLGGLLGVVGVGVTAEGDNTLAGITMIATGGLSCAAGALLLIQAGRPAREYKRVSRISNPEERERVAQKALASIAAGGKPIRYVLSAISALGCVIALVAKEENITIYGREEKKPITHYVFAGLFGAVTIGAFIWKTPEERAYQNYLEDSKQNGQLKLCLGINPYGGMRIGLSFSF